jgi:aryl-alcohol dehydrogenase-like predicted oxidoreductase
MTPIPQRPFGTTGITVPAISMGCGFPIGYAGFEQSVATIRHALSRGITLFDTSPFYRQGASQAILGEALATTMPHPCHPLVATKVGHFREARSFRSVDALFVQLGENLRLLRRDSVDLLQIHEADWDNWWHDRSSVGRCVLFDEQASHDFANAPVIQFLREAKARGLCRYIGITGNNARHIGRLLHELTGIDAVLIAYNYMPLNASARQHILPIAKSKGIATLVAGLFTFISRIPEGWRTEGTYFGKHADDQLAQLQRLQKEAGIPLPELTLRWAAADDRISTLLLGACQPAEVDQNIASLLKGPLPKDLHAAIDAIATQKT